MQGDRPLTPKEKAHLLSVVQCALEDIWEAGGGEVRNVLSALGSMLETTLNGIEDEEKREAIILAFLSRLGEGLGMEVRTLNRVDN